MATPDTRSSIVIVKQFTFMDATKRWSNRYHFTGPETMDSTHWAALADAIVAAEKHCITGNSTIVEAIGYDASTASSTNPHGDAVFTKTYSVLGLCTPSNVNGECPGDCAAVLRYSTDARSSKNHPIYLFNYFHDVYRQTSDQDKLDTTQLGAFNTYGAAWVSGFSDGTDTRVRCGPRGAVGTTPVTHQFISHRDFRR